MSFDSLLSEGYIEASVGAGTFVSRALPEELMRPAVQSVDPASLEASTPKVKARSRGRKRKKRGARLARLEKLQSTVDPDKVQGYRLSWYATALRSRQWLNFSADEPAVQLSFGRPAMTEFPMRVWNQLLLHHARKRNLGILDSPANAAGFMPLREQLAAYLSRVRAVACQPEQVIIVNGSQQGIDLVARCFDRSRRRCLHRRPGLHRRAESFEAQGANVLPIPVDKQGIVVEAMKEREKAHPGFSPQLIYVTPSHQSPTGVVLSVPRRLDLISFAKRVGAYIVEDDYDSEYRYKRAPDSSACGTRSCRHSYLHWNFVEGVVSSLRLGYLVVPLDLAEVFLPAQNGLLTGIRRCWNSKSCAISFDRDIWRGMFEK